MAGEKEDSYGRRGRIFARKGMLRAGINKLQRASSTNTPPL
jgi:hypothetical protein